MYVYILIDVARTVGFFAQRGHHDAVSYLYFSYITLTTVGYGDLTAGSSLGRMLAVIEALVGQLYLVTIVALVVGNIGRQRVRPTSKAEP
jgi:voltage-gated potassium channel Kch